MRGERGAGEWRPSVRPSERGVRGAPTPRQEDKEGIYTLSMLAIREFSTFFHGQSLLMMEVALQGVNPRAVLPTLD